MTATDSHEAGRSDTSLLIRELRDMVHSLSLEVGSTGRGHGLMEEASRWLRHEKRRSAYDAANTYPDTLEDAQAAAGCRAPLSALGQRLLTGLSHEWLECEEIAQRAGVQTRTPGQPLSALARHGYAVSRLGPRSRTQYRLAGARPEVPSAAVTAMIWAAANPAHDDDHTDTYYEGLLSAALPHLVTDAACARLGRAIGRCDAHGPSAYRRMLRAALGLAVEDAL